MTAPARGSHRAPASPRRVPAVLWRCLCLLVAVVAAPWLYLVGLERATTYVVHDWGAHRYALVLTGWIPVGGFVLVAGLVALRIQWVRDRGRRLGLERHVYELVGFTWLGFALITLVAHVAYRAFQVDLGDVMAQVTATPAVAIGLTGGDLAVSLGVAVGLVYALARIADLEVPAWPVLRAVALSMLTGAAASLAVVLVRAL